MLKIKYSGKMKKDLKTCQKRGYNFSLLEKILDKLQIPEPLGIKSKDHDLKGNYKAGNATYHRIGCWYTAKMGSI